jgi:glutathione peroxidase
MNLLATVFSVLASTSAAANPSCTPLLDHAFKPLAGKTEEKLCNAHANKVLLVVNVASKCGFTNQYEGLEKLHATRSAEGFAVLGFPSNEFGGQEPGTEEQIKEFCTLTYGVKFPMYQKISVKGDGASAFYKQLAADGGGAPKWNFHKYLIGRDGKVIKGYASNVKPDSPELLADINAALAKPKQ